MRLARRAISRLTPVLEPLLERMAPGDTEWSRKARTLLMRQNLRRLERQGQASLHAFERRVSRLGPGDLCLDLGASLGLFTEKLAATGAEVHAYEPDPHCFARLARRFEGRANVHLHPQAVAAEPGRLPLRRTRAFLQDPDVQSTSSSIAVDAPQVYDEVNAVMVDVVAFHDVVRSLGRSVALVKMDIEGAEFAILDRLLLDRDAGTELPIGALFVERHERHFPDRFAMVRALRRMQRTGQGAFPIDTYWP